MHTVKSVTYELLRKNGIKKIFGNPGSNELPFLKNLPNDFEYILALHEGVAVGIADGYSLVSQQPALLNLHSASGSGNAMGALTNSWYSHSPLIVTAGQQVRNLIGLESMLANINASQLPKPLVKWSYEPLTYEDVPRALSQAIHIATQPAKGPVYVSIPYDDWDKEVNDDVEHLLDKTILSSGSFLKEQLNSLIAEINNSKNPVLVLGPDVDAYNANDVIVLLSEKISAPVWVAPSAPRCPFPNRHPNFYGVLPASIKGVSESLTEHDLVIVIGAPVFRYHQNFAGEYLPENTKLIHISCDINEVVRAPMGIGYIGNIKEIALDILSLVNKKEGYIKKVFSQPKKEYQKVENLISPEELFDVINNLAPSDAIYVKESTSTVSAFWQRVEMSNPSSYFFPASGGLGFGLPAAVGAQMATTRQVIGIIGDGSANYGITALWTAKQYNVPVIFIILKNGTYGALRWFSKILDAENSPGLDIPDIDFCAIAKGYGVPSVEIKNIEDFQSAFKKALKDKKPVLLEVLTTTIEP